MERALKKLHVQFRFFVLILLGSGLLSGCAPITRDTLPTVRPAPVYDRLFPYYVEICAVSQIRAHFAKHGGSPGHAVMYLKGACRDPEAEFPTIKVCDPGSVDLTDPESGVGISVNKMFKNVNWLAIPGKQLFFFGNLDKGEVLDESHARETIQTVADMGLFKGIQIKEKHKPPEDDLEAIFQLLVKETLGTDFALTFGRTIFSARLPVTREMMEKIVNSLNELNREYALGEADYDWSGYHDNCSHTLHNALAAASIWPFKRVQSFKVRQFFNLSIPANEFADLGILANTLLIENFCRIYGDKVRRKSLLEQNWLPARHGALLKIIPVHQNNELYDTKIRIFMLQNPFLKSKSRKIGELYRDPRNTEIEANLRSFKDRYEAILEGRRAAGKGEPARNDCEKAREAYYSYFEEQLADVNEKIGLLEQIR
jgi:hypothetical protein